MLNGDNDQRDDNTGFDAWVNPCNPDDNRQDGGDSDARSSSNDSLPDTESTQPADAGSISAHTVTPPRSAGSSSLYNDNPYRFIRNTQFPPQPRKPRNGIVKTISLTVFITVLIIASAITFMESDTPESLSHPPATNAPFDFFSQPSETKIPIIQGSIPRAPLGSGLTLNIEKATEDSLLTKQEVYSKCSPCVVAISASIPTGGYYWGTGVIMSDDGYIITNSHIIEDTVSVKVTLFDDSEYEALLVGADVRSDIAVLKIDAADLPFAQFGDSSFLEVGEDVVAIGNPLGSAFRNTITNGIISSISRDVRYENYKMNVLQTTAAVNDGNSGGPLINMYGQVVGITNMKMVSYDISIEGIAFAIPTSTIKPVVDELIERGYVSGRPAIGITPGNLPLTAKDFYSLPEGLYVRSVNINSDAFEKGIKTGDIIVAAQGVPVVSAIDLNNIKDLYNVGDTLTLTIYRDGDTFDVDIVLCDMADLNN